MGKVNLFFVGKPKCGTTILYEYFKKHKDIFVPIAKEPSFFNDNLSQNKRHTFANSKLSDYEKLYNFKENKKYYGDFSPSYLFSNNAARNIFEYNPDAKIVAIFREPMSFLESACTKNSKHFKKKNVPDFKKTMLEDWNKNYTKIKIKRPYSEHIKYSDQLQKYLEVFPKEQIMIIIYEEFKEDNQKTMNEICDFLGIERITIQPRIANPAKITKYPKLWKFLHESYILRKAGQKVLPFYLRRKWGKFVNKISFKRAEKETLDPKFRKQLKKKLKPEVVKLNNTLHSYNLIDKDLVKFWGYDKV